MSERIDLTRPVQPLTIPGSAAAGKRQVNQEGGFAAVLDREIKSQGGLNLSRHAERRLLARQIAITPREWARVETAVARAQAKGARDTLILMQDLALIVNIPNRTVVTALDSDSMKENIFTNIDSAVIL